MMEMAETASLSTTSDTTERRPLSQSVQEYPHRSSPSESLSGSVSGSRERLISSRQNVSKSMEARSY